MGRRKSLPSVNDRFDNELDISKMVRVIGCGIYADDARSGKILQAVYALVDDERVSLTLDDQRKVSTPIEWYPRLQNATPAERNDWRIIMNGRAVLWPSLGIAISAKAMLEGEKASETPAELRKWLNQRKKQSA
jgi:hypothetical protein